MVKKINNKLFNKTKKKIQKNSDIIEINSFLSEVQDSINKRMNDLSDIEIKALSIKNKIEQTPKNARMENIIEELSASNLRELEGDFSKKLRYQDLLNLYKMNKKSVKIIEEQEILMSKEKILNIELLQKKIEILLKTDE